MSSLPLKAILFWIAVTLSPPDTSQVLVKGPDTTMAWTKQTAGWSLSTDRSVWNAEENTVSASIKGKAGKREADVASYIKGVKDHDWKESATLKLPPGASLAKEGETYVYTRDEGSDTAKRYVIRFRRDPAAAKHVQLGYVGETSDDKRSFADSGHAIAFDRPADAKYLSAIQIYASRYGLPQPPKEDFHVYVLDKDQKVVQDFLFPYSLIARGQQRWYTLDLPVTEVPERFHVALAFHAHQTKGIYLGLDRSVKESHSYTGLPGDGFQPVPEKYDWMVRARLVSDPSKAKSQPGAQQGRPAPATASAPHRPAGPVTADAIPAGATRLSHVGDASEDKRSLGGSGHAVAFDRPETARSVVAIQIYASRYGLPEPPAEDFHVWLVDKDRKVLQDFRFPYAKIARGPMHWYTLELPSPEVPEHFYVALSFNPEQTKGIYLGLDKSVKESHSYVGLPGDGFQPVPERYDWMVRVYLAAKAENILSNPGAEKGGEGPDDWCKERKSKASNMCGTRRLLSRARRVCVS